MHYFQSLVANPSVSDTDSTEILDTDFDSDSNEDYSDISPNLSVGSLAGDSVTTASTPTDSSPEEPKTPDSTGLTGFHFAIDENPVKGPVGPHLFRIGSDGSELGHSFEVDLTMDDFGSAPATISLYNPTSTLEPDREDTPVPKNPTQNALTLSQAQPSRSRPNEREVSHWSPQDVVLWLQSQGFEDSIVEKFFINDITGAILLELQSEDLKELDIQSFGKRHRVMGCIRQLRTKTTSVICDAPQTQENSDPICREDTTTPNSMAAQVGVECSSPSPVDEKSRSKSAQQRRRHRKRRDGVDIVPEDSVSIVAIEQLLPRLHTCSKGENCRKWQKQQVKLTRMLNDLPIEGLGGSVVIAGDPGNATTAQNMAKTPKSEITPSIVASSDALGQNQNSKFQLSQDKLNGVRPRDPQENVRNFLNFQRLSELQPVTNPSTPPIEQLSPATSSPQSVKANGTLSENLRHLPRLRIPSTHASTSTLSPNYSAQRTITPSILRKHQGFSQQSSVRSSGILEATLSPSDYYRIDPHYDQSTPFSEVDIPLTAIPVGPVSRGESQSVPPNMRFGGQMHQVPDLIPRPASTKAENVWRNGVIWNSRNQPKLGRLEERSPLPPIDTPEDMEKTPRAAHCRTPFTPHGPNKVAHSGWMKKRKNTRFLRHDWEDHHFTLRGTQLAMYSDEESSSRESKALEYIDVDDYAVACSSFASSSKLTAAFKKTVLKRKNEIQGETAFTFSLIPSPTNGNFDKRNLFLNGPKAHYFAVKTRDERIDWMRELMLAKALRKGRENGTSIHHNGNFI
ncbi:hypothetical protein ASPACDRAFT_23726 [Aspergillus aculeatus ATCC 16872]|uniref:SAM and PH domain protein n=1 Tax=Aspergillus aculeatus (strain ATCC 16872 / CBS 172.66 / WB 5094) TaxID=690307 RepID=A0A1L9X4K4_ASPA1|nr:uncharacterized protein ASPACDRAFT_23726 [Aspergillus aculeatus ATCC 16872]OJK03244.1 hypothetical protein ASPACDRAFT_23726 [Aspergillus aculeatus ATCC 16872]